MQFKVHLQMIASKQNRDLTLITVGGLGVRFEVGLGERGLNHPSSLSKTR